MNMPNHSRLYKNICLMHNDVSDNDRAGENIPFGDACLWQNRKVFHKELLGI
jgi:hypothetical protein